MNAREFVDQLDDTTLRKILRAARRVARTEAEWHHWRLTRNIARGHNTFTERERHALLALDPITVTTNEGAHHDPPT